jgi:hypothetical protein
MDEALVRRIAKELTDLKIHLTLIQNELARSLSVPSERFDAMLLQALHSSDRSLVYQRSSNP